MLNEHLSYVSDERRLALFESAAHRVVMPGAHVIDAGCGTAILGLLCIRAGAVKVTAIESSAAIELARESMRRAGISDMFEFIRANTFDVVPEITADVVVCDHVGYFGFDYGLIEILGDARRRLLKPGGAMMPQRIRVQLAAVRSDRLNEKTHAWSAPAIPAEFHWLAEIHANEKRAVYLQPGELATETVALTEIDLRADQPAFHSWPFELVALSSGPVHGLAGWFNCELAENVWMTNSPLSAEAIHRPQAFLPFTSPILVNAGDELKGSIMARPADGLVAWSVRHPASGTAIKGSTWQSEVLPKGRLHAGKASHVPVVSLRADACNKVLALCDGKRTVAELRAAVLANHPHLLPTPEAIGRFVDQVVADGTE